MGTEVGEATTLFFVHGTGEGLYDGCCLEFGVAKLLQREGDI